MVKGDPNKPRGKMSAYAFFVLACREEIKKKHPRAIINLTEFSKACAERWKTTTPKERGKFEDLCMADKFRYEHEMKSYIRPEGEPKRKYKKDPNKPKKPPTSFFLFSSEHRAKIRAECPGLSLGDTSKKLSEKWAEQSPTDRIPFEQKAAILKENYDRAISAYRASAKDKGDPVAAAPVEVEIEEEDEEDVEVEIEEDDEEEYEEKLDLVL